MPAYARPVLCRLCGFPAPDGGVPVSEVDREKLSEWCLRMMDTDLDQKGLDDAIFCQFCVADAKFEHENDEKSSKRLGWWNNAEDTALEKFYSAGLIQPCAVRITNLTKTGISYQIKQRGPPSKKKSVHPCIFCQQYFSTKKILWNHVRTAHRNATFFCCYNSQTIFKTKNERQKHCLQTHKHMMTCIYCDVGTFDSCNQYKCHMQYKHKSEAIRCRENYCTTYFKTKQERDSHMHEKHPEQLECIFCKKIVSGALNMRYHVRTKHRSEAIDCKFNTRCAAFFKTEAERELHILKVHLDGVKEKRRCIYCLNFFSKECIKPHINSIHKDVAIQCPFNSICLTYFHTEEQRLQHVKEVHESGANKAKCVYCLKMIDKFYLPQHIRSKHSDLNIIRCDYNQQCPTYFFTEEEKQEHILEKHEIGDNKTRCIYCKKMVTKDNFGVHLAKHHKSVVIIKCNFHKSCATYFHTEEQREEHIVQVHKTGPSREAAKCIYCGNLYADFIAVHDHVKKVHADVKIKCTLRGCQTYFFTQKKRKEHFQQVHQQEEALKVHQCQECNFKTKKKLCLSQHVDTKHGTEKIQCPQCPEKYYRSQFAFKRHCNDEHRQMIECRHCHKPKRIIKAHVQKTACKFCKEVLPCKSLYFEHLKKHRKYSAKK